MVPEDKDSYVWSPAANSRQRLLTGIQHGCHTTHLGRIVDGGTHLGRIVDAAGLQLDGKYGHALL